MVHKEWNFSALQGERGKPHGGCVSWLLKAGSFFRQKSQGRAVGQMDQLCQVPKYEGTAVGPEGMPGEEVPEECGRRMGRALGHTERFRFYPKGSGELWGAFSEMLTFAFHHAGKGSRRKVRRERVAGGGAGGNFGAWLVAATG